MCLDAYLSSCWFSSLSLRSSSSTRCPNGSEEMDTMLDRMTLLSLLPVSSSWSWEWLYLTLHTLKHKAQCQTRLRSCPHSSTSPATPGLISLFSSSVYISLGHGSEKDPSPHSQGLWEDNSAVSSKIWLSQDFSLTNLSPIPKYSVIPPSPRLSRTPVAANTRNEKHVRDVVVVALSYLNRIKTALIDPAPLSLRDSILWLTCYHALIGARVCVCAQKAIRDSEAIISSDSHLRADTLSQSHTHSSFSTEIDLQWAKSSYANTSRSTTTHNYSISKM